MFSIVVGRLYRCVVNSNFRFLFWPVWVLFRIKEFLVLLQVTYRPVAGEDWEDLGQHSVGGFTFVGDVSLLFRLRDVNVAVFLKGGEEFVFYLIAPRCRRVDGAWRLRVGRCVFHVFAQRAATRGVQCGDGVVFVVCDHDRHCHAQAPPVAVAFVWTAPRLTVRVFTTVDNGVSVGEVGLPWYVCYDV